MKWYALNKEYVNYLRNFDSKVPNVEYSGRMKCFLGAILKNNNIDYFAPLTSYKPKFLTLKNDVDFYKIVNPTNNKIYGAIDINNMIPVPKSEYTEITFENLPKFREFKNKREQKSFCSCSNP